MRFQTELKKLFEEASNRLIKDAEEVWKVFKGAILAVSERIVVARQKAGRHRKTTSWWNNDVKEAVKRKKLLYRKALNG